MGRPSKRLCDKNVKSKMRFVRPFTVFNKYVSAHHAEGDLGYIHVPKTLCSFNGNSKVRVGFEELCSLDTVAYFSAMFKYKETMVKSTCAHVSCFKHRQECNVQHCRS